jgi:hypothetical protein
MGRKLALLAMCCILQTNFLSTQTSRTGDLSETRKQELVELENHWLRVEDNPSALDSILAPDFVHVVPAGIISKHEQLEFMRKHPAPRTNAQKRFENLRVRVYGEVGIVNGMVVANEEGKKKRTMFTDVFAYRDGKWQAVNAQELPAKAQ